MLDPVAEGVAVVPQKCPAGVHDQHADDVKAELDLAVGRVDREPGRCHDLKVAALDLAALKAAIAVLGCGDVDEDQGALVVGDQVDLGSLGEVQPASRSSKPLRSMKRVAALTAFS